MTRDVAISIAKKLKALSESAESGEKLSAEKKLKAFCILYELDLDEYSTETVRAIIPFANQNEKILLSSIMCMIMEVDAVKGRVDGETFVFQCTSRQLEDITDAFNFYKNIYSDYVDGILFAIINKNEIKNRKPVTSEFKMEDMTPEEKMEYLDRMNHISAGSGDEANRPKQDETKNTPKSSGHINSSGIDEQNRTNKKNERIQRMFSIVEQNKWIKKVRPKFFLS